MADILDAAQTDNGTNTATPSDTGTPTPVVPYPETSSNPTAEPPVEPAPEPILSAPSTTPPTDNVIETQPSEFSASVIPPEESLIVPPPAEPEPTLSAEPTASEPATPPVSAEPPPTEPVEEPKTEGGDQKHDTVKKKSNMKVLLAGLVVLLISLPLIGLAIKSGTEYRSRASTTCKDTESYCLCAGKCVDNRTLRDNYGSSCSKYCGGGGGGGGTGSISDGDCLDTTGKSCKSGKSHSDSSCATTHQRCGAASGGTTTTPPPTGGTENSCCCAGGVAGGSCMWVVGSSCPAKTPVKAATTLACKGTGITRKCCCAGGVNGGSCTWVNTTECSGKTPVEAATTYACSGSQNTCQTAGGSCENVPSCSRLGRSTVNGGNGCNAGAGEICCSTVGANACENAGGSCENVPSCSRIGASTINGGNGCNAGAGEICCSKGSLNTPTNPPNDGGGGGNDNTPTITKKPNNGGSTPTPTPIQCINIKVYNKDGAVVTPSSLQPGDVVTLGYIPGTGATKIRFRVNSTNNADWKETTTKNATRTNEFNLEWTVPTDATAFTIEAQYFDGKAWH